MHWIIQNDVTNEGGHARLLSALVELGVPHSIHKLRHFEHLLDPDPATEIKQDQQGVWVMGVYEMRDAVTCYGFAPGWIDLEAFDYVKQHEAWGDHMLNGGCTLTKIRDCIFPEVTPTFVRPVADNKTFAGRVMRHLEWTEFYNRIVNGENHVVDLTLDTVIQLGGVKQLAAEYRCWIVDGEIATISQYRIKGNLEYKCIDDLDDLSLTKFVRARLSECNPAPAFVLDVCLVDTTNTLKEEFKIVEAQTLNASGLYAANMFKLVMSIEKKFGVKTAHT